MPLHRRVLRANAGKGSPAKWSFDLTRALKLVHGVEQRLITFCKMYESLVSSNRRFIFKTSYLANLKKCYR